jgi:hypothetical protein
MFRELTPKFKPELNVIDYKINAYCIAIFM